MKPNMSVSTWIIGLALLSAIGLAACSEDNLAGDCKRYCERAYACMESDASMGLSLDECKSACADAADGSASYGIDPDVMECALLTDCTDFVDCVTDHGPLEE